MSRSKIFISYSHEDERWRKRVASHLAVLAMAGLVDVWDDRRLEAGEDWFARIHEEMLKARVAVLLVSSAFLSSRFILEEEVPKLFGEHERAGMAIYPLLVKPCPWQEVKWLARLQIRPPDGKAVARYSGARIDEVLAEVAREIGSMVRTQTSETIGSRSQLTHAVASVVDIRGEWKAEVTYDWENARHTEVFSFKVDGDEVYGTASFLGTKRTLLEGKLDGNKLTFITKSLTMTSAETRPDWTGRGGETQCVQKPEIHRYRGKILGDEIQFVMQTESDSSEHSPVEFTARKIPASPADSRALENGAAVNPGISARDSERSP